MQFLTPLILSLSVATTPEIETVSTHNHEAILIAEGGIQLHSVSIQGEPRAIAGLLLPLTLGGSLGLRAQLPMLKGSGLRAYGLSALWRQIILSGPASLYVEPSLTYRLLGGPQDLRESDVAEHLLVAGAALGINYQINDVISIGGSAGLDFAFGNPGEANSMKLGSEIHMAPKMSVISSVSFD